MRKSLSAIFPAEKEVKKVIKAVLNEEKIVACRLAFVLVSDSSMRRLNSKFLLKGSSTDVLAFDLKPIGCPQNILVADIVVSADRARSLSKALHISLKEELYRYFIHGILHLKGYDDSTKEKKERMWKRQEFLLKKVTRYQKNRKVQSVKRKITT